MFITIYACTQICADSETQRDTLQLQLTDLRSQLGTEARCDPDMYVFVCVLCVPPLLSSLPLPPFCPLSACPALMLARIWTEVLTME